MFSIADRDILSPVPTRAMASNIIAPLSNSMHSPSPDPDPLPRRTFFTPISQSQPQTPSPSLRLSQGYPSFSTEPDIDSDRDASISSDLGCHNNKEEVPLDESDQVLEGYGDISLTNAYFIPSVASDLSPRHFRQQPLTPSLPQNSADSVRRPVRRTDAGKGDKPLRVKPLRVKPKPKLKKSVLQVRLTPASSDDDFKSLVESVRVRAKADARRGIHVPVDFSNLTSTSDYSSSTQDLGTRSRDVERSGENPRLRTSDSLERLREELEQAAARLKLSDHNKETGVVHASVRTVPNENLQRQPINSDIGRRDTRPRSGLSVPFVFVKEPPKSKTDSKPASLESRLGPGPSKCGLIPGPVFVKKPSSGSNSKPLRGSAKLPKRSPLPVWDVFVEDPLSRRGCDDKH